MKNNSSSYKMKNNLATGISQPEEVKATPQQEEMKRPLKDNLSNSERGLSERSGSKELSVMQRLKLESARLGVGAPDSEPFLQTPRQVDVEQDSFIRQKIEGIPIKRIPTPVIDLPADEDEDLKVDELGDRVEMNPLEILEENQKDKKIGCFKIKYFIAAVRYYIQSTCYSLIQHPLFETVSLLVILANCVVLSLDDPTNDSQDDWQIQADYTFQALYTLEIVLKVLGLGFMFNEGAYIRDPWNILDFIIVIFGYLSYLNVSGGIDLKALRTFRILRPLRTISSIEGLKILMSALVTSLPLLMDTIVILVFFFLIFAIAGVQLWNGLLLYRCVNLETGDVDTEAVCGYEDCASGYSCIMYISNPNYGGTNFDDVFSAFLTVFQCVTMEGWTDTQYILSKAFGPYSVIFFTPLVVIGAFFLVNFTLAVIKSRVSKLYEENRKTKERARLNMLGNSERRQSEKKYSMINTVAKIQTKKNIEKKYAGKFYNKFLNMKNRKQKKEIMDLYHFIDTENDDNIESWGSRSLRFIPSPPHPIHEEIIDEVDENQLDDSSFIDGEKEALKKRDKNVSNRVIDNFKKSLIIQRNAGQDNKPGTSNNIIEVKNIDKTISFCGMEGIAKQQIPKQIQKDFIESNMILDLDEFTIEFFKQYSTSLLQPSPSNKVIRKRSEISNSPCDLADSPRPLPSSIESTPRKIHPSQKQEAEKAIPGSLFAKQEMRAQNSLTESGECEFFPVGSMSKEELVIVTNSSNSPTFALEAFPKSKVRKIFPNINNNNIENERGQKDMARRLSEKEENHIKIFSQNVPLEDVQVPPTVPQNNPEPEQNEKINEKKMEKYVLKNVDIISSSVDDVIPSQNSVKSLLHLQTVTVQKPPYKIKVIYTPTEMPEEELEPEEKKMGAESLSVQKGGLAPEGSPSLSLRSASIGSTRNKKGKKKIKKKKSIKKINSSNKFPQSKTGSLRESDQKSSTILQQTIENGSVAESKLNINKPVQDLPQGKPLQEEELSIPDQIKKNLKEDANKNKLEIMYSGQEVLPESDPYMAVFLTSYLNVARVWKRGFAGKFSSFRYAFKLLASSMILENLMNLLVMINTITLAMDRYGQPENEEQTLSTLNIVFTSIFIAEMAVKLFGLGIVGYLSDTFNYLDGAVVIFSIVEIIFLDGSGALSAFRTLRVFRTVRMIRTFRVLRVARLLRSLRSMQTIIDVIGKTIGSFAYIGLLLLIFIFIYALFGMQLYGGEFDFPDGKPRQNFDSFHTAFLSVFQVLTMENWHTILYSCMRAVYPPLAVIYLVTWIFIGNYILLNLFLAIMLDAFTEVDEQIDKESGVEEESSLPIDKKSELLSLTGTMKENEKAPSPKKSRLSKSANKSNKFVEEEEEKEKTEEKNKIEMYKGVECNYSLYIFHKSNPFREINWIIVSSNIFEGVVLTLICLGALKLSVDTYFNEDDGSTYYTTSYAIDIFLAVAFTIEALMKAISYGFVFDKGSYLRDSWNQLDFFIVIATMIDISVSSINIPMVKVLRMFRTFRPLRFVTHNVNMKVIVTALFRSLGAICNTLIVVLVIWLMFSIVGVTFFAGKFQYCSEDLYVRSDAASCVTGGGEWRTYDHNFDNVINGMIFLFIMTTQENWNQLVLQATDCTDVEQGPVEGNSWYYAYYFVFFLLVGSMFLLNLFVGVMFLNFTKVQKQETAAFGDILISEEQLNWIEVQKMIIRAEPNYNARTVPPHDSWRKPIHSLVTNIIFEVFIAVIILLNMIQLAMLYNDASNEYLLALDIINYIFTGIFTVEIILKLIGFGNSFWYDAWNVFDFVIVICSYVDIIFSSLVSSSLTMIRVGPQLIRVLRVLRVSRLLRLIKKYKRLQDIMEIIQLCLPSMLNVFSLLFLILFIYAVLGCYLFDDVTSGDAINNFYNFHNFGYAMILCFKIATGEDWNTFMFDCARTTTSCAAGVGCGNGIAYFYFITFKLVVTFIMLNLFILIVLQLFEKFFIETDNIVSKFKEDFEEFQQQWQSLFPSHGGFFISKEKVLRFFRNIPKPLGLEGTNLEEMSLIITGMHIKLNDEGNIFFNELLFVTMRRVYHDLLSRNDFIINKEQQTRNIIRHLSEKATQKQYYNESRSKMISTATPFTLLMIERMTLKFWKKYLEQHRERVKEQAQKGILNYQSSFEEESPQHSEPVLDNYESPSLLRKVHPKAEEKVSYSGKPDPSSADIKVTFGRIELFNN